MNSSILEHTRNIWDGKNVVEITAVRAGGESTSPDRLTRDRDTLGVVAAAAGRRGYGSSRVTVRYKNRHNR